MDRDNFILGVDGGGSKTVAWLARVDDRNRAQTIGRGGSGPSNCRSVGIARATRNLDHAIESAFDDAKHTRTSVGSACFSLAGADRGVEQQQIRSWAHQRNVAARLIITNDAMPVLYAASREGIGIALISGTGSLAIGRNAKGETARCGGWGGLLGDEGSGYQISLAGLRAAARAIDGRGPQSAVLQGILDHFEIVDPSELIPVVYSAETDRSKIAKIAPIVFQAAESGDAVATAIVNQAAADLQELVVTLAARLNMADEAFTLAVTGGVLLHQADLVAKLLDRLVESKLKVSVAPIENPVAGAIVIALQQ